MIGKHAMIGIRILAQVEMVYLVYHGHGIVAVVILRIIQPTMAAFVANIAEQVQAALLRNGAKITRMCVMAWYTIVWRGRRVERTERVLVHRLAAELPPPLPLPRRLIHLLEADQICMMCMTETLFESES